MANANRKHIGAGSKGKGDGSGAMTDLDAEQLPENTVLSNRDKAQHSRERGLDGKTIQTEQYSDHSANKDPD
ncbi:hypothetical protein RLEG3_08735 (plasmid) [Rhizobium leguminosarum bv. trifolii WSM1689]|uniref:hypothetical protein n=1 Tax=Rhizobium leguminosarum TaxID=384 RepID=UPI0003E08E50|nr:hypothetical protein [Rhizobium leguminosarum]AHF87233.1 hypothetical protein RLEG3_08735 [Rhizobium leguminosarum bv. trifolii WSM1689]MBY5737833.1 hypothetical protein [Rhizobium leguminosarum]